MNKEDLKSAFDLMDQINGTADKFLELGIDIIETPLFSVPGYLFDLLIESNFTEEGQDVINWWYFEKKGNPELDLKMLDKDGNELCSDFDALWDYVKDFKK